MICGKFRSGEGDLIADFVRNKAGYAEVGAVDFMLSQRERRLVGLAARHVVTGYLRGVDGLAVFEAEDKKKVINGVGCVPAGVAGVGAGVAGVGGRFGRCWVRRGG